MERPYSPPWDPEDEVYQTTTESRRIDYPSSAVLLAGGSTSVAPIGNVFAGLDKAQAQERKQDDRQVDRRSETNDHGHRLRNDQDRDRQDGKRMIPHYCHGCKTRRDKMDCWDLRDCEHTVCPRCLPGISEIITSHLKCPVCDKPVSNKSKSWKDARRDGDNNRGFKDRPRDNHYRQRSRTPPRPRSFDNYRQRSRSPRRDQRGMRDSYDRRGRDDGRDTRDNTSKSARSQIAYKRACPIPSCKVILHSEQDMEGHLCDPAAHIALSALVQPQSVFPTSFPSSFGQAGPAQGSMQAQVPFSATTQVPFGLGMV